VPAAGAAAPLAAGTTSAFGPSVALDPSAMESPGCARRSKGGTGGTEPAPVEPGDVPHAMARSRRMRSEMGGWVLNRCSNPSPLRGWAMYMCDTAGFTRMGIAWVA